MTNALEEPDGRDRVPSDDESHLSPGPPAGIPASWLIRRDVREASLAYITNHWTDAPWNSAMDTLIASQHAGDQLPPRGGRDGRDPVPPLCRAAGLPATASTGGRRSAPSC